MLLDFDWIRPAPLDRVAQAVQRADARIAAPREHHLTRAAAADHLIEQQIGGHADQRQVRQLLPDDLVSRREGNQMGETFESHGIAGSNEAGDRVRQGEEFGHRVQLRIVPRPAIR